MSAPAVQVAPAYERASWSERVFIRTLSGGSGRPLAVVVLAMFLALSLVPEPPLLDPLRLAVFDAYQLLSPRVRSTGPATIVAIDEASLAQYGQWPWPRSLLARLLDQIGKARPAAVGVDLIMPEPDRLSPKRLARSLTNLPPDVARQLARLPGNDEILARSMRKLPVVLGTAGLEEASPDALPYPAGAVAFFTQGGDANVHLRHFASVLTSTDMIDAAARGHGLLSADPRRGIIRRIPLVASVGGLPAPAFSLEVLRLAAGESNYRLSIGADGVRGVGIGEMFIPTESDGSVWLHFGPRDATRFDVGSAGAFGRGGPGTVRA